MHRYVVDRTNGYFLPDIENQRNANLARIRDNQRRSRARRKEYLQELEIKYRTCEQVGVEASAEIQAAARRVVEENKRLRHLLKQQGLSDAEIDGMSIESPQYPTAATSLEGMIGQRRSCGPGSDCGSGGSVAARRPSSCDSSLPTPAVDSQQDLPQHPQPPQPPRLQPQPRLPQPRPQVQHFAQPLAGPNVQYHQSPHSTMSSGFQTPDNQQFPSSRALSYSGGTTSAFPVDYSMQFDEPFQWDSQYPPSTSQPDMGISSSCYVAAGAIRSIKPDIGYELETELGCGDGRECNVPNTQIFSIMDRYSEGV